MKLPYEDLKIGDIVRVTSAYLKPRIKDKEGIVVYKGDIGVSVFFHENIGGHEGWNSKKTHEYRKVLAKKYNVPVDNCWNFDTVIYHAGKIIVVDTKIDIKFDLYELAKI